MPHLPLPLKPGLLGDMTIDKEEIVNLNIMDWVDYPGVKRCFAFVPVTGTFSQYLLLQHMVSKVEADLVTINDQVDEDLYGGIWFEFFQNESYPDLKTRALEFLREYLDVCCECWNMKHGAY